jgi:predicted SprT family Zn-dependent metalloprotease
LVLAMQAGDDDPNHALLRLVAHYRTANIELFESQLPGGYGIAWNRQLRRLSGRITYQARLIELSLYHFRTYGYADAVATLEHEMLHLYLHVLGQPSGHSRLFKELAARLGIRVFHQNSYPRNRLPRHRHVYECPACSRMVFRRRLFRHRELACGVCCRERADGQFDRRFLLRYLHQVRMG